MSGMNKICSVERCAAAVKARGLCNAHYQRMRRKEPAAGSEDSCVVKACDRRAIARGLCALHDGRRRRTGSAFLKAQITRHCAAEGCEKPSTKKGYCGTHYARLHRHGHIADTRLTLTAKADALNKLLDHSGDECRYWLADHGQRKYPKTRITGRLVFIHRWVCEQAHGSPPTSEHEAAHSCGNGHLGCVSPQHLRWATTVENQAYRLVHETSNRGEKHGMSKLSAQEVRWIRNMAGKHTQKQMAEQLGVTNSCVRSILHGKRWAWLDADNEGTDQ